MAGLFCIRAQLTCGPLWDPTAAQSAVWVPNRRSADRRRRRRSPLHRMPTAWAAQRSYWRRQGYWYNSLAFVMAPYLFTEFEDFVKEKARKYGAKYWSCTLEMSEHSEQAGRLHFHMYLSWHDPAVPTLDHRTTDDWIFKGVRPRVDVNKEKRGPHEWRRATQHGHFYVQVMKQGTLEVSTNYPPFTGIWAPEAWWVTSLWKAHKLDHQSYLHLSAQLRDGHDRRKANVEAVIATETFQQHAAERRAALDAINARAQPFKPLQPEIEAWMRHFEELDDRYKFLVLYGPSRTGKSRLARSLFGYDRTLVVDILNAEHPNLKSYRRGQHRAVLLDEMKGPAFICSDKKIVQSHVDGAELGQSPTQQFVYESFLWRTPIIITTNNWDLSCLDQTDQDWLLSNAVAVHLAEPVWMNAAVQARDLKRDCTKRTPLQTPEHKFHRSLPSFPQ